MLIESITIKDDIFEFRLLPGDQFTEQGIAEKLSASRTPIRQALFRLQQEGYIEVKFRNGWQVAPFDFEKFEYLYELRIVLELDAIRRWDFTKPSRITATYDEHAQILKTILKRRTDEACRLMQSHIELSKMEVRKITIHMLHAARNSSP